MSFQRDLALRRGITKDDAPLAFELGQSSRIAEVIAFHVADGNLEHLTHATGIGEGSIRALNAQLYRLADVLESGIAEQSAGQQPGFAENLEAVADAEYQATILGKTAYLLHDRSKLRNCAGAEVITIGKAAGDDNGVAILEIMAGMPEERNRLSRRRFDRVIGIVIAIRARENQYTKFHRHGQSSTGKKLCGYRGSQRPGSVEYCYLLLCFAERMHIADLLRSYFAEYGYWTMAVVLLLENAGIPLPGETTLLFAAALAF